MSIVTISVAGRVHAVACDDGQETRVERLAQDLDQRAQKLLHAVGSGVGEGRLLVMLGLTLADESDELRQGVERMQIEVESLNVEMERARQEIHRLSLQAGKQTDSSESGPQAVCDMAAIDRGLTEVVTKITQRIETIAERLEKA